MANPNQIQQQTIAETPDDLQVLSSYLKQKGVGRHRGLPFFIEMVDREGNNVALPYPPIQTVRGEPLSKRALIGIRLLVNPGSINVNMARTINRTQTMVAWSEDHWGEEIDTLTFQGTTAAFVLGAPDVGSAGKVARIEGENKDAARAEFYSYMGMNDNSLITSQNQVNFLEPGLTTKYRRNTLSYREFRKLIQLFAMNGCIYDEYGFVQDRKFVQLTYDYSSYLGYFESIDVTEDATMPFRMIYTVTFKSEKTVYSYVTRKNVRR